MRLDSIERIARALNDNEVRFIVVGRLGGSCPRLRAPDAGSDIAELTQYDRGQANG